MSRTRLAIHPILLSILSLAALSALGCSTGAKPDGMVQGARPTAQDLDVEQLAQAPTLAVSVAGGWSTNPLHTSKISGADFREALVLEIARSGLFRPVLDEPGDYRLEVDLVRLNQPFWGFLDMEVELIADWRLYEATSGALVWERQIDSRFTATGQDSEWGIRRLRLANEGSARRNIRTGIGDMAALDLRPRLHELE